MLKIHAYKSWTSCVAGDVDTALAMANEAVSLGNSLSSTDLSEFDKAREMGHALNTLATVHWAKSEFAEAKELYGRAVEIALNNGMKREAAVTYGNIGLVLEKQGQFNEAVENFKMQLQVSTEVGEKVIILTSHGELGMISTALGNFDQALFHFNKQRNLAESIGALHDELMSFNHLASLHRTLGNRDLSNEYLEKTLDLAAESNMDRELGNGLYLSGMLKVDSGDFTGAIDRFNQAETLAESVHSDPLLQNVYIQKAEVFIVLNRLQEAEILLAKVDHMARRTETKTDMAAYLCARGKLLAAKGEYEDAIHSFKQGINIYNELDAKFMLAEATERFAVVLSEAGANSSTEVSSYIKRAISLFEEMNLPRRVLKCTQYTKTAGVQ